MGEERKINPVGQLREQENRSERHEGESINTS